MVLSALALAITLANQTNTKSQEELKPRYKILNEKAGLASLQKGTVVSVAELRIVDAKSRTILDTKDRGMPLWIELKQFPTSIVDFAAQNLGKGGSRVVLDSETGTTLWITIRFQRRF